MAPQIGLIGFYIAQGYNIAYMALLGPFWPMGILLKRYNEVILLAVHSLEALAVHSWGLAAHSWGRSNRVRIQTAKPRGPPAPEYLSGKSNEKEGIQADFKQIFRACFWGFWLVSVRILI